MQKVFMAAAAGMALFVFGQSAFADDYDKKTTFTTSQTIMIPGRTLPAGTYVMKLQNSSSNRNIVQIYNAEQNQLQATILAIPNYKVERSDKTEFSYWETPAGMPPALKSWFWPGDNDGQEFAYPKDVADRLSQANNNMKIPIDDRTEVSSNSANSLPDQPTAAAQPQLVTTSQTTTVAVAEPVATVPPAVPASRNDIQNDVDHRNTDVLLAQNQPQPSPVVDTTPVTVSQPSVLTARNDLTELPKTASATPWFIAIGLAAFILAATLRYGQRIKI